MSRSGVSTGQTPGEEDPEPDSRQPSAVVDEENYSHNRRQQLIEDYRERTFEVRTEAHGQLVAGGLTRQEARQYYRAAVESYLLQVLPLFERDDIDFRQPYLNGVDLGVIEFHPPDWIVEFARDNIIRLPDGQQVPTPTKIPVTGLRSILDLPSPLSEHYRVAVDAGGDLEREEATVVKELPRSVLDQAMQVTDKALEDADLGINVDEKTNQTKITDDLVKEVDEWRRQNVE